MACAATNEPQTVVSFYRIHSFLLISFSHPSLFMLAKMAKLSCLCTSHINASLNNRFSRGLVAMNEANAKNWCNICMRVQSMCFSISHVHRKVAIETCIGRVCDCNAKLNFITAGV